MEDENESHESDFIYDTDADMVDDVADDSDDSFHAKRGLISDAISTGQELSMASGAVKDFIFHMISPILKSLKKDRNKHALQGFTHHVLP